MPIYEYECERCQHRVELIQKRSDPPLTVCPRCQAEGAMKKLLAAPALQFKGSGFYITDYPNKGKEKSEGTTTTGSKPAADTTTTSTPAPAASEKKKDSEEKKKESNASPPAPPPKSDGRGTP
jgi:putative FmdB family regulatory protein